MVPPKRGVPMLKLEYKLNSLEAPPQATLPAGENAKP